MARLILDRMLRNVRVMGIGKILINPSNQFLPHSILRMADPERALVDSFINSLPTAKFGQILLDAGAGSCRYKSIIEEKGYIYESHDFQQEFDEHSIGIHKYVSDITNIVTEKNRFNSIVCTQVLEHLEDPLNALLELHRVTKEEGLIYLTTNFLFPIHSSPYDFFRFTNFGLEHLFNEAGFKILSLEPRGGFFYFVSKLVYDFPSVLKSKFFYGNADPHGSYLVEIRSPLKSALVTPLIFVLDIFCTLFAALISRFDFLDQKRRFTLGYQLIAIKV